MLLESGAGAWENCYGASDGTQEKVTTKDTPMLELRFTSIQITLTLIFKTSEDPIVMCATDLATVWGPLGQEEETLASGHPNSRETKKDCSCASFSQTRLMYTTGFRQEPNDHLKYMDKRTSNNSLDATEWFMTTSCRAYYTPHWPCWTYSR